MGGEDGWGCELAALITVEARRLVLHSFLSKAISSLQAGIMVG